MLRQYKSRDIDLATKYAELQKAFNHTNTMRIIKILTPSKRAHFKVPREINFGKSLS